MTGVQTCALPILKKILISNIVTKRFANPNAQNKNRFTKLREKISKKKDNVGKSK